MLGRQCSIYDVEDIEAFVIMCIKRSGVKPMSHEWEDLVAEGIALLWAMSNNYKVGVGCFSGYAVKYMPRKIRESYNRGSEHALHRTQDDGTRKWEYYDRAVSLDALMEERRDDSGTPNLNESTVRLLGDFVSPQRVEISHSLNPAGKERSNSKSSYLSP